MGSQYVVQRKNEMVDRYIGFALMFPAQSKSYLNKKSEIFLYEENSYLDNLNNLC